jgi:hypothetical protein
LHFVLAQRNIYTKFSALAQLRYVNGFVNDSLVHIMLDRANLILDIIKANHETLVINNAKYFPVPASRCIFPDSVAFLRNELDQLS